MTLGRPYSDDPNAKNQGLIDVATITVGSTEIKKQLGFFARGVIIDNLTNQWIFIREPFAWIPPYVSGRSIPLSGVQAVSVSFSTPTGFTQQTIITGQTAFLRFTAALVGAAPGVPVAPAPVRWSIIHSPTVGVQASVTKAAAAGVVHVADTGSMSYLQSLTTAAERAWHVNDGVAGGGPPELLHLSLGAPASAGNGAMIMLSSNMGLKGTIGNAMTDEFTAGDTGIFESVNLVGYDA